MRANIPDVATLVDQVLNSTSPEPQKTKIATTAPQQLNSFSKIASALRTYQKPKVTYEILDIVKEAAIHHKKLEFKIPNFYGSHPYQKIAHQLRTKNAEQLNELIVDAQNILKAQLAMNILDDARLF